jgi:hypothetical protein
MTLSPECAQCAALEIRQPYCRKAISASQGQFSTNSFLTKQDIEDFKIAATVFWLSFSANQRGCLPELRASLLNQLVSGCDNDFYKSDDEYKTEFERLHDNILAVFTRTPNQFATDWVHSPAGEAHFTHCEKMRYVDARSGLTDSIQRGRRVELVYDDIFEMTEEKNKYDGIKLGIHEVGMF